MAKAYEESDQMFLLKLSDSLRAEVGVEAVGNRATQLIAQQLGVDRVYLVSLNPDDDIVAVTHEARRQDMPPLQGSYRSSDFPAAIQEIFERTIVYTDVRTDARLTELDRLSFAGLGAVGFMAASLRRGTETMIWAAGAVSSGPRSWTATEVVMFEDAVERTWAAVERARAEAALRKSEEKYRSLFNSIDEGFVEMEMVMDDAGRVVDWRWLDYNPAFERMSGLKGKKGQLFSEIVPKLEPEWAERYGHVVATGEALRFELPVGGLDSWFDIFVSRVGDEGDRKVVCVFNNITARKRHEANLAFLSEVSQDLVDLTRIDETMNVLGAKIGRYFAASHYTFVQFNETADEAVIESDWHRADLPSLARTYRIAEFATDEFLRTLRAGEAFVLRDRDADLRVDARSFAAIQVASCIAVPISRAGELRFVIALYDDVARNWRDDEIELMRELTTRIWMRLERARAEETLLDSQKRFESIANLVPDLLWESQPDGSTTWYNQRWLEYTGQRFDEAIGWGWTQVIHPDDREASVKQYREAVAIGQSLRQEHRIRRYDGAYRWFVVSALPLVDQTGQVVKMYGAATDIDDRKRLEATLLEAARRKDEFLAMLAHELRNPMATIRSGLQILTLTDGKDPISSDTIAMMNRQTAHLVRLVDELLDVSRISQGKIELKRERLDLGQVVAGALEAIRPQYLNAQKQLHFSPSLTHLFVNGDLTRLSQVVTNLATNGLRYTGAQGHVWVSLQAQQGEAVLRVADNGVGLSEDQLTSIFELFVQVDNSLARSQGGLGIGLTLVKRLVDMHGGRITATSAGIGQGSEFTVYIPLLEKPI